LLLAGEGGALVGHLEEEQERELLQVVLVREPVVPEDVAIRPELLDDAVGALLADSGPPDSLGARGCGGYESWWPGATLGANAI
jgi:hypothetical protein